MACCTCKSGASGSGAGGAGGAGPGAVTGMPLICLVPRSDGSGGKGGGSGPSKPSGPSPSSSASNDGQFVFMDEEYIKKNFNLPQRALYLDPFRRPLISFPMSGENTANFNMARKQKINQQILDGFLDSSAAISAQSVFPYPRTDVPSKENKEKEDEEIIYILQLPDWEFQCPVHNQTVRTPRFIWHSCKKSSKAKETTAMAQGGGPMNKPKPWLLSRHTDFDMTSRW